MAEEAEMPQIFHRGMNTLAKVLVIGGPLMAAIAGITGAVFYRSSYATGRFEVVEQPVPFSHLHHVGQLGIDCRYCHTAVETSSSAGFPSTKICMNCHQQMWVGADLLAPVRTKSTTFRTMRISITAFTLPRV
jgi:Cytochrome c7 and related cytochrome c